MIRLVSVFPEQLNLNGDQANIKVLADFLVRCGLEVQVSTANSAAELEKSKADFVLVGHGSAAAHEKIEAELSAMATYFKSSDAFVMFVGSSTEAAVEKFGLSEAKISRGDRESEFSIGQIADFAVLGYRNTDSGLPNIWQENRFLFCMLHGPVLAKNPKLQHWLANQIAKANPLQSQLEWFEKLNEVCHRIWQLETETAFEKLELI